MDQNETDRVRTLRIVFQGELKDQGRRERFYHNTNAQLERLGNLIKHFDLKYPIGGHSSRTPTAKELRTVVMRCVQDSSTNHAGSQAFQLDPATLLSKKQKRKYLQKLDIKIPLRLSSKPSKPAKAPVAPEQDLDEEGTAASVASSYHSAHEPQSSRQSEEGSSTPRGAGEVLQQQLSAGAVEIPESARPTPSPLSTVNPDLGLHEQRSDGDISKRSAATAFDDEVRQEGAKSKRQKTGSFILRLSSRKTRSRTTGSEEEAPGLTAKGSIVPEEVPALGVSALEIPAPKDSELQVLTAEGAGIEAVRLEGSELQMQTAEDAGREAVQQSGLAEHLPGDFTGQKYPYGLRGVDDVDSQVQGLVQLFKNASDEVVEDLALEDVQAQFVTGPPPGLAALYKRIMCRDGESWKTKASQLGLQGLQMKHLLTMCISAAVYEEVFCKELPWKPSRQLLAQPEIAGRLESLAQLLPGLGASGPSANAAYLIYQSGADMLREGSDFDQSTIVGVARSLAETLLLTIQAQLKCCKSNLNVPGDFSEKTTGALANIFRKALLLRGRLEEAPHDFEYTWATSMAPFIEQDMTELRGMERLESVIGTIFPGVWRRDEQGELHLISRLQVYGRPAARKRSASKA